MTHRVVEKMRYPLVSAGETVDAQSLVSMSRGTSFIVPESSDYGWALNQAVWELDRQYGTQKCMEMYRDKFSVFVFDACMGEATSRRISLGLQSSKGPESR